MQNSLDISVSFRLAMGLLRVFSVFNVLFLAIQRTESAAEVNTFNTIKITKIVCNFNPEWIQNGTCRLKAINRIRQEVSIEAELIKPLNNFWVHAETFKLYNSYRRFVFTYDINLCEFFRKSRRLFFLKSAMEVITSFSNLNHSCPYMGKIIFKGAHVVSDMLHIVIPSGRYRGDVKVTDGVSPEPVGFFQFFIDANEMSNKSVTV